MLLTLFDLRFFAGFTSFCVFHFVVNFLFDGHQAFIQQYLNGKYCNEHHDEHEFFYEYGRFQPCRNDAEKPFQVCNPGIGEYVLYSFDGNLRFGKFL